jgi:carbon-monoxide dehydrogenase large subunit
MKGRLEDARYLKGAGSFTSDRNLPGQLHAHFLRSDRPHAEIVSLDVLAAGSAPGVHAVFTARDLAAAGIRPLPVNSIPAKSRDGSELIKTRRPALAEGRVRFVGEPLACVVADSLALAQDAAELIEVEYRDLPHVTRAVDALEPGAPQLHDNVPGNRVLDFGTGSDEAQVEQVFRKAARVVTLSLYNNRVTANPIEPRAA